MKVFVKKNIEVNEAIKIDDDLIKKLQKRKITLTNTKTLFQEIELDKSTKEIKFNEIATNDGSKLSSIVKQCTKLEMGEYLVKITEGYVLANIPLIEIDKEIEKVIEKYNAIK